MRPSRLFLVLYSLSGAAALLYEVIWLRLLTLSMGHTAAAVGTVLAAFMGGLAIGAWRGGRAAASLEPDRALRAYAALEIAVALCALLLPLALGAFHPLLAWAYAGGNGGALFDVVRLTVSLVLIAIPAAAMGATYPIAVKSMSGLGIGDRRLGIGDSGFAGSLYAANTIGAAAGAALTGFVLLPMLGLFGTTIVGVAINAAAAGGALLLRRRSADQVAAANDEPPTTNRRSPTTNDQPATTNLGLAAGALGVSGFVALVYEVTWTRILAMILGPTTYAFSAMLVAFIAGLAIGSTIAASLVRRIRRPGVWLGVAMIVMAALALIASARVDRLPLAIAAAAGRQDASFTSVFAVQIAMVVALQLPMTIALGAAFPLAIALGASARNERPADAATIYAVNTAGAIAGALAASFVMIPLLGLQTSIQAASLLAIAAGLVVAWRSDSIIRASSGKPATSGIRIAASLAAVTATALAVLAPPWNHELMANGAYRFAPALAAGDIETGLEAGRLVYYGEGAAGTVSVRNLLGVTSLAIDGKVDASNRGDMLTQKLLAHLPLLLHPNPRTVNVIGLGSGVTLGAALTHPIERADVVEISPEVVAASEHFKTENHDALRDGRTHLIVGDGRSHLWLSGQRYDVIISEPSNPWMAGVATLFTREFFLQARSRLAPGGILCQWAHTYNISGADLRSIVGTFLSVFPDGSAWLVGEGDLLLIGSTMPVAALDEGLSRSWARPGVAADLAEVGVREPFSLFALFVGRGADLQRYAAGAIEQSDDRLSLEFSAPRAIYGRFQDSNVDRLRQVAALAPAPPAVTRARGSATALEWKHLGQMELQADAPGLAYDDFREALLRMPDDSETLDGFAHAAAASSRISQAETFLRDRASTNSVPLLLELSTLLGARGQGEEAARIAQHAAALDPGNMAALEQLVSSLADSGNQEALAQLAHTLEQTAPGRAVTLYCEARLQYIRGDFAGAADLAARLTMLQPDKAWAFGLLGSASAAANQNDRARLALEAALRITPRDAAVLVNLGLIELRSGNAPAAEERFSQALFLYPTLAPALDGLAQALEQQGRPARAATIRALIKK